ncbi:hypothetical protein ABH935_000183 [Catenulispora sp. GAS73]
MTLASYEQKAYGGKHVNATFSPQAMVWVIQVDAPTSHHWAEKHLW